MLNEIIKALRMKKGITRAELAQSINITERSLIAYEQGTRNVPVELLLPIADYFGVTTDYLLGRSDKALYSQSKDFPQPKTIAAHITGEGEPVVDAALEKRIQEIVKEAFEKYGHIKK